MENLKLTCSVTFSLIIFVIVSSYSQNEDNTDMDSVIMGKAWFRGEVKPKGARGNLKISDRTIMFNSKKYNVEIPFSEIVNIKQGYMGDYQKWVKIMYQPKNNAKPKTVGFFGNDLIVLGKNIFGQNTSVEILEAIVTTYRTSTFPDQDYIIKNRADTVFGNILYRDELVIKFKERNANTVIYVLSSEVEKNMKKRGDNTVIYSPDILKSYFMYPSTFVDVVSYKPPSVSVMYLFLEPLVKGRATYYEFTYWAGNIPQSFTDCIVKKINSEPLYFYTQNRVINKKWKKLLSEYLFDNEQIADRIAQGYYTTEGFELIIRNYNSSFD